MPQVVRYPGCEQLPQGDCAERRVLRLQVELGVGEVPRAEQQHVLATQASELVRERVQRPAGVPRRVAKAIVWGEATVRLPGEDDPGPRDPVGLFAIDE